MHNPRTHIPPSQPHTPQIPHTRNRQRQSHGVKNGRLLMQMVIIISGPLPMARDSGIKRCRGAVGVNGDFVLLNVWDAVGVAVCVMLLVGRRE